MLSHSKRLNKE